MGSRCPSCSVPRRRPRSPSARTATSARPAPGSRSRRGVLQGRAPGDLVAGDRGRQVLTGRPQRPQAPRRRRRPGRLRGRPEGLCGGDRGDLPARLGPDLHRGPHPRLAALRQLPRSQEGRLGAAADLHPANAEQALVELNRFDGQWGQRCPATVKAWRDAWEHVIPFLALPDELRRAVYTTNTIEGLHRQIRKAIKTRGHFPDQQAATKLICLATMRLVRSLGCSSIWVDHRHDAGLGHDGVEVAGPGSWRRRRSAPCHRRADRSWRARWRRSRRRSGSAAASASGTGRHGARRACPWSRRRDWRTSSGRWLSLASPTCRIPVNRRAPPAAGED